MAYDSFEFISSRGCVYKLNPGNNGASSGGYKLAGLPEGSANAPILVVNSSITENELILPTSTLDRKKVIYTFGEDYGNVTISGIVFLGSVTQPTEGLTPVIDYFQNNAVTRNGGDPVNLSVPGGGGYRVYLRSLRIHDAKPQLNAHGFSIIGIKASPPST